MSTAYYAVLTSKGWCLWVHEVDAEDSQDHKEAALMDKVTVSLPEQPCYVGLSADMSLLCLSA